MKFDVIGLDSPCVDLAVNVRCFPKPNGAERIQNLSWQGGGKVASGMVAAARLGLCCGIMGNVGDDKYGTFCLRDFQDHGIDTEQMCVRKNRTRDERPNTDEARGRDTQCGMFAATKVLQRYGLKYSYIYNCTTKSEEFLKGYETFIRTAAVLKSLRTLRIAKIGERPVPFMSVMTNEAKSIYSCWSTSGSFCNI